MRKYSLDDSEHPVGRLAVPYPYETPLYWRVPSRNGKKAPDNAGHASNINDAWRSVGHEVNARVVICGGLKAIRSNMISGLPGPVWRELASRWDLAYGTSLVTARDEARLAECEANT